MRHSHLALIATGATLTGGLALMSWRSGNNGKPAPLGSCAANPLPAPRKDAAAPRIPLIAGLIRQVWPSVTGEAAPPPAALEIMIAQAYLESGVGTWWTDRGPGTEWANGPKGEAFREKFPNAPPQGDMRGSKNLHARQCGINDKGGSGYTCVPYGDSQPDAKGVQHPIQASFRFYSTDETAVRDFVYDVAKQWPALAELKAGDVLAYAMRQGPKYRADDPPNQLVYGREYKGGNGYYGGFGATMEARVGGYAKAIASHLPAVAAALGHDKIHACVAPEVLGTKAYTAVAVSGEEDVDARTARLSDAYARDRASVKVEGAGTVILVIAGLLGALVVSGLIEQTKLEAKATEMYGAFRGAGIEVVPPGADLAAGMTILSPTDPQVLKALSYLGEERERVLRVLAGQGLRLSIKDVKPPEKAKSVSGVEGAGLIAAAAVSAAGLAAGALAAHALTKVPGSAPARAAGVLLIGDSFAGGLTAGLKEAIKGRDFFARHINGTTAIQWAADPALPDLLKRAPAITLISLGTNDFAQSTPDQVRQAVNTIVGKVRGAGSEPRWILPPSTKLQEGAIRQTLEQELARLNVPAFDSRTVSLPKAPDGIHSTPAGYKGWAERVAAWLLAPSAGPSAPASKAPTASAPKSSPAPATTTPTTPPAGPSKPNPGALPTMPENAPDEDAEELKKVKRYKPPEAYLPPNPNALPIPDAAPTYKPPEAYLHGSIEGAEILSVLDLTGQLSRARALPGSNGASILWYLPGATADLGAITARDQATLFDAISNAGAGLVSIVSPSAAGYLKKSADTLKEGAAPRPAPPKAPEPEGSLFKPPSAETIAADKKARENWTPEAETALEECLKKGGDLIACSEDPSVTSKLKDAKATERFRHARILIPNCLQAVEAWRKKHPWIARLAPINVMRAPARSDK